MIDSATRLRAKTVRMSNTP
jgi:hypothetical protein